MNERDNTISIERRTRRRWTMQDKAAILKESRIIGVQAAAEKHKVGPGLVYSWVRQQSAQGDESTTPVADQSSELSELQERFDKFADLEAKAIQLVGKIFVELEARKVSTYNAANTLTALIATISKLDKDKTELSAFMRASAPASGDVAKPAEKARIAQLVSDYILAHVPPETKTLNG